MLSKAEKDYIIELLDKGEAIPEDYRYKLFPIQHREYELVYAGKMRKEDLLADEDGSFPVPLQIEKVYNGEDHPAFSDGWKNLIVFGDNLQFLKTIYKNEDLLIKDKIRGKIKLIYIDPPFATSDEFQNKDGAKAYSDKKDGAEFIEYLRKRIILAHSILADDGSIFVHLDWKMAHYIKIVLDEVFGKNNLRNEIVWAYNGPGSPGMKQFNRKHDTIFWYSKSSKWIFNDKDIRVEHNEKTLDNFKTGLEGSGFTSDTYELNKRGKIPEDWWQIAVASRIKVDGFNRMGYPTEKPVKLIERIIRACSNKDDIVMDFFAGSGVVASVAERLNRRWISCDIGKLSYYTVQKRILEIAKSKSLVYSNRRYNKLAKSFISCSLGTYDLKNALNLEYGRYKEFVSGLFNVDLKEYKIGGYSFDGRKDGNVHKILSAFTPLLRKNKKSISSHSVPNDIVIINTNDIAKQTKSVGMLRQDSTVFLTNNWENEIVDEEQREIIAEVLEDESLPKSSSKEIDYCLFKTPVTTVLTSSKPERKFVDILCKKENADLITSWIKSRDRSFYEIEYSMRYGSVFSKSRKYKHDKFNPDFFIKMEKDGMWYYLVVEIKDDGDDSDENKAKYKYSVEHFARLNDRMIQAGIPEQYIFHFLSPNSYDIFFNHLKDGSVLEGQDKFRCALENLLEEN